MLGVAKRPAVHDIRDATIHRTDDFWQYLQLETSQLCKEFEAERKWKEGMAKFAIQQSRHHLKILAVARAQMERQAANEGKTTSAAIARLARGFWMNIAKVVKQQDEKAAEELRLRQRGEVMETFIQQSEQLATEVARELAGSQDESDEPEAKRQRVEPDAEAAPADPSAAEQLASKLAHINPSGADLATTKVRIEVPSRLLKCNLREYQIVGLHWLRTLHDEGVNGILADEMGLGKTVQTIALFAHLALNQPQMWGPHLVIVPTSLIVNWEVEFKRWCPGLKILRYHGSSQHRAKLRQGWTKENYFHVCITSYQMVVADARVFQRKSWYYLVLDEAQHIKNWKSQKWQTLLRFKSAHRLLLTGTPLQNDLMELWSLMHFLMPGVFASNADFKQWFSDPITSKLADGGDIQRGLVRRLHSVLRPFFLRRLKRDVEKQMPKKFEHVLPIRLSKRQRCLYDEFMDLRDTRHALASGGYHGVLHILMQLRKVCNHPDLFEERVVSSPVCLPPLEIHAPAWLRLTSSFPLVSWDCPDGPILFTATAGAKQIPLDCMSLAHFETTLGMYQVNRSLRLAGRHVVPALSVLEKEVALPWDSTDREFALLARTRRARAAQWRQARCIFNMALSLGRHRGARPILGVDGRALVTGLAGNPALQLLEPFEGLIRIPHRFAREGLHHGLFCRSLPCVAAPPRCAAAAPARGGLPAVQGLLHSVHLSFQCSFPGKFSVQQDCGKMMVLAQLLHRLRREGHKCLIFTQMTRLLDILEEFLSVHRFAYLRLDGSTKATSRRQLVEVFNTDPRVFLFIATTRAGGVGLNLTAADTVIFYESDWNPAMDRQAMDRCHRIGQTKDVHVYRLISEYTVEENIWRKQIQKRRLDDMVMDQGKFTIEALQQGWSQDDVREMVALKASTDIYGIFELWAPADDGEGASGATVPACISEFDKAAAAVEDPEDARALAATTAPSAPLPSPEGRRPSGQGIVWKAISIYRELVAAEKAES